jgi:succinate-semialdehyde dehydrogenase/glutarate-semialdehyde dehydrogenase
MARSGRNELLRIVSDDVRLTLAWAIWSKMAQLGGLSTREAIVREYLLYVGGAWIRGGAGTMPATSPSTGERFAEVAVADLDDVDRAVEAARFAAAGWAALSAFERAACCESLAGSVRLHRDELARALAQDQGKPLFAEAYGEVDELSEYLHMAAEDAKRLEGVLPPSTSAEARVLVSRVPLGVVGVVSPWNWPYTMGAEVFAPALAAGNTVVWVPAPTTAACSGLLAEVIAEGGLPPGVFNFLPGPGPVVGDGVVSHPGVDAVGFIGSVATGRKVARRAAGKTQVLELGGNGPMVVLEDADLGLATEAALEAAYMCAGQSCTAGERFLVHASVRAEFVERVVAATVERVRLGDPFDASTTMGPLNNEGNASKFDQHVADAREAGATVCCGGARAHDRPTRLFAEPTVLDGVRLDMLVARDETFGPVVPVIEISSDADALEITNGSPFGLTAAVFTDDLERGLAFAEAARVGWVNINASTNLWEAHLPFGGRSGSVSGRGRVGGRSLLEAFTEPKTIRLPAPRRRG